MKDVNTAKSTIAYNIGTNRVALAEVGTCCGKIDGLAIL